MQAIGVRRGEPEPTVLDIEPPEPGPDEVLVRTLRVGIDGTDHEVIAGGHGGFPDGEAHQILGHEAVGIVKDGGATGLTDGTTVVPTVRRPRGEDSKGYFTRGEPDMAPPGTYVECGIEGAHGFMAEYFVAKPEFLVGIPGQMAEHGFLVEPISNIEKALDLAWATRSTFDWQLETAAVLGNGPLGLLALAILGDRVDTTYCVGRRDRPDPTIDIIERLGATYVDSRKTSVADLGTDYEPMDVVVEATGYAKHAFATVEALAPNGVGALLGIPSDWSFEIPGGQLHREFVLTNKSLVGSVNSHIPHFEAAITTLDSLPDWFIDALCTNVHPPTDLCAAFGTDDSVIKSAIQFDTV